MASGLTGGGVGPITGPPILSGNGSPEGIVTAQAGALYRRTDLGGLYVKSTGIGNTGWSSSSATDPDQSWEYASVVDDHFDGDTLDATKWTSWTFTPSHANYHLGVLGSHLNMGTTSINPSDNVSYGVEVYNATNLPDSSFRITYKIEGFFHVRYPLNASECTFNFYLYNDLGAVGFVLKWYYTYSATAGILTGLDVRCGAVAVATRIFWNYTDGVLPKYQMIQWDKATQQVIAWLSSTGHYFYPIASSSATGLTTSIIPDHIYINITATNAALMNVSMDWIRLETY